MLYFRKSVLLALVLGCSSATSFGQEGSDKELQKRIDEAVAKQLEQLRAEGKLAVPGQKAADGDASVKQRMDDLEKRLPFTLHGGAYLWHYEPFQRDAKNNTELYFAHLIFDAPVGEDFGFHFEPRFRDSKLRPFFQSNVWVQEVYASWKIPSVPIGTLKAGKEYSRFGHFWDGSFFGNLPYFDGLKLDPDIGLSLENNAKIGDALDAEYSVQYFVVDGRTNGSLQDRDTLSVPGARERNSIVACFAPTYHVNDDVAVTVGVSGQRFQADLPSPADDDHVTRYAVESEVAVGPFSVFGEYSRQHGRSVSDFPLPGAASNDNHYVWAGAEYHWKAWCLRYNYSTVDYREVDVREVVHQPGVVYAVNDNLNLRLEYDYWRRSEPSGSSTVDSSLNFIIYASF